VADGLTVGCGPTNRGVGVGSSVVRVETNPTLGGSGAIFSDRSVCCDSLAGVTDVAAESFGTVVAVGAMIVAWDRSSASSALEDIPATETAIQATTEISRIAPIAAVAIGARVRSVRDSIRGGLHSIAAPAACATKPGWWGVLLRLYAAVTERV
jgi:hypothetical protein